MLQTICQRHLGKRKQIWFNAWQAVHGYIHFKETSQLNSLKKLPQFIVSKNLQRKPED